MLTTCSGGDTHLSLTLTGVIGCKLRVVGLIALVYKRVRSSEKVWDFCSLSFHWSTMELAFLSCTWSQHKHTESNPGCRHSSHLSVAFLTCSLEWSPLWLHLSIICQVECGVICCRILLRITLSCSGYFSVKIAWYERSYINPEIQNLIISQPRERY
jgi:hypothetical protein